MDGQVKICKHDGVDLINPYEIIRKYRCRACCAVMMCECDRDFGTRFLAHQLNQATDYETYEEITVTHSFQIGICSKCRGESEKAWPRKEGYGRRSKVSRYYWREIFCETMLRLAKEVGNDAVEIVIQNKEAYGHIEREVTQEIQREHETNPKYKYNDESSNDVVVGNAVEVISVSAEIVAQAPRGVLIKSGLDLVTPEVFAAKHFSMLGYECLETESLPFHVLFATFMWFLIADPSDPKAQSSFFGNRTDFEDGTRPMGQVWVDKPIDFGTAAYAKRRETAINEHLKMIPQNHADLIWLFDYWLGPSEPLRQYLWAHRTRDIEVARRLIKCFQPKQIHQILRYLIGDYWGRYLGWPDLICFGEDDFIFVEVKASKDKLSEDQKRWIRDNRLILKFPFRIFKIHRQPTL